MATLNKKEQRNKDFITLALDDRKSVGWVDTAKRLLAYYAGKDPNRNAVNKDIFQINTTVSLVNLLLPNFILQAPFIKCMPRNTMAVKKVGGQYELRNAILMARKKEAAVNHLYKKIDAIDEQQKALKDALFYPYGVTKVGYSYDTLSNFDADYDTKDTPFLKRICPEDFFAHPMATGPDDSEMLSHRFVTTKSRLKQFKDIFSSIDKIPSEVPQRYKDKVKEGVVDRAFFDSVTVFEVLNQEENMYYYYGGTDGDIFLGKRERDYDFLGSDYSILRFNADNDCFAGLSLLGAVEDQIIAIDEFATLMVEHARKFTGQVFVREGTVDDDQLEAMRTGELGSVHLVKDVGGIVFKPAMPNGEYGNLIQMMQAVIDRIIGTVDFARTGGASRKSATESSFIQGDVTMRRAYYTGLVKKFVLSGIRKLAALQAQYYDGEEEILCTGQLDFTPIKYTKEDIQGDYLFDFDVDSMAYINQAELSNLMQALNIMAQQPALQPILRTLDPDKLGTDIFKRLNLNINSYRSVQPESAVVVPPERENELARQGEPMPQPKWGEDHNFHIEKHFEDLLEKGDSEQIMDHIAATVLIATQEGVDVQGTIQAAMQKKKLMTNPAESLLQGGGAGAMPMAPAPQAGPVPLATSAQNLPPPSPNEAMPAPSADMAPLPGPAQY